MQKKGPITYIVHTQIGFEQLVAEQIQHEVEGAKIIGTRAVADKNGMVLVDYAGDAQDLFALRSVEDVFAMALYRDDLPPVYAGLKMLTEAATKMKLDHLITTARAIKPGRGGHGKLPFRVVARQVNQASYRRIDGQEALEKGLRARSDFKWEINETNGFEFWLTMLPREVFVALRLTDASQRRHDEKRAHLPASLRPSAAASMIWLSRPRPTDIFLDPMCGAGTLLIERGEAGRYKQLLGGDIREEAVEATLINIGPRYKPIEVQEWDARELPLDEASVTNVAVNLPFGRQIGTTDENRSLYPAFLREMGRVVRPAGRLVMLTGDVRSFERTLERNDTIVKQRAFDVQLLGRNARLYLLERR